MKKIMKEDFKSHQASTHAGLPKQQRHVFLDYTLMIWKTPICEMNNVTGFEDKFCQFMVSK